MPSALRPPAVLPHSVGLGLKPQHYAQALRAGTDGAPSQPGGGAWLPAWFEVHPQNWYHAGGPSHRWLAAFAKRWPLSFHSVGLSLGSAEGGRADELDHLADLCDRYEPAQVSDHLSWSGTTGNRLPDLLPLPYTHATLDHFAAQVARVQDRLKRTILIENPSRYLAFAGDELDEPQFLHALCRRTGCGLLLDLNNVEVSATNLGFCATRYVDAIDPALVGEVHLAGHATEHHADGLLLIDDHGSPVSDATWQLYARFTRRAGARPTLIEWDTDVPAYAVLLAEGAKAAAILDEEGLADAA